MDAEDLLSEVFSTLRLESDVYFWTRFSGQYSVLVPSEKRRIRFHLILRGSCWLQVENAQPIFLSEGDVALIPNGASQILAASPEIKARSLNDLISQGNLTNKLLEVGTGVESAALLCGYCSYDEEIDHPILSNLPAVIHLRVEDLGAEPSLTTTMKLIALEANLNTQGTSALLARMIEIIVIQATRRLVNSSSENSFISALSNPALSKALLAIHRQPDENWRVGDLANLAGMSRAAFAMKFTAEIGRPPLEYLTDWRLMRARSMLSDTNLSIDEIAERCGYKSLPSFSRRFKLRYNIGPGAFRRKR